MDADVRHILRRARRDETSTFVEDVAGELDCAVNEAEKLAVAVIATIEERLSLDDIEDLEAELPVRLRELVAQLDRILDLPGMDDRAFRARVAHRLRMTDQDAETAIRAVFRVLADHLSPREARRIHLPR